MISKSVIQREGGGRPAASWCGLALQEQRRAIEQILLAFSGGISACAIAADDLPTPRTIMRRAPSCLCGPRAPDFSSLHEARASRLHEFEAPACGPVDPPGAAAARQSAFYRRACPLETFIA